MNKGIFNRKLFLKIHLKLSNVKIMNFTYSSFTSGVRYLWDLLFIAEQEGLLVCFHRGRAITFLHYVVLSNSELGSEKIPDVGVGTAGISHFCQDYLS